MEARETHGLNLQFTRAASAVLPAACAQRWNIYITNGSDQGYP
jgi:hypothetical protein